MTITEVMLNFRQALFSLVPSMERVGIPWDRSEAYDEWDTIASTVFDVLVVEVLRWSLPKSLQEEFKLPRYDLLLSNYAGLHAIEVETAHPALLSGRNIFHAFSTLNNPLDAVEVRQISNMGVPNSQELIVCPIEEVRFRLRISLVTGGEQLIEKVNIQ